jgi:hypothetical protein
MGGTQARAQIGAPRVFRKRVGGGGWCSLRHRAPFAEGMRLIRRECRAAPDFARLGRPTLCDFALRCRYDAGAVRLLRVDELADAASAQNSECELAFEKASH